MTSRSDEQHASPARITSETGRLRSVALHSPGPELDRMLPENIEAWREGPDGLEPNPAYLLFDDLVLLSRLREEHDQIRRVLRAACGHDGTLEVRDMLRTVLHDPTARQQLIDDVLAAEAEVGGILPNARALLDDLDPHNLVRAIIIGALPHRPPMLRWPSPNLMFARDLGVMVGRARLLTYAAKPARVRDMLLSRVLLTHHPAFGDGPLLDVATRCAPGQRPRLEGGDVLVLSADQVAIGIGDRTDEPTARLAAAMLHEVGVAEVHLVWLRSARATMHLDTVFTLVSDSRCLAFPPLVTARDATRVVTLSRVVDGAPRETARRGSLLDILAESGLPLEPILCGGADPTHQAREQWSDGANAFALGNGQILLYGRNQHTLRQLNEAGFEVLTPDEFCRNATLILGQQRPTVVAIEGSELSRGRGGPRCLTLPVSRS